MSGESVVLATALGATSLVPSGGARRVRRSITLRLKGLMRPRRRRTSFGRNLPHLLSRLSHKIKLKIPNPKSRLWGGVLFFFSICREGVYRTGHPLNELNRFI